MFSLSAAKGLDMGQTTAEILESQQKDATASKADDLLSQLAGNEIDRLLAEADVTPPPAAASEATEVSELPEPPTASALPPPEAMKKEAELGLEAELDHLLADLKGDAPKPASETPPPPAEAEERAALLEAAGFDKSQSPAAEPAPVPPASDVPVGSERSALLAAAGFENADGSPISPEPETSAAAESTVPQIPFFMRPLIWINAPLANSPTAVRQMLGGAAIVTLLNALAVLVYVLVFRKH
jgi:hypothetical protein